MKVNGSPQACELGTDMFSLSLSVISQHLQGSKPRLVLGMD